MTEIHRSIGLPLALLLVAGFALRAFIAWIWLPQSGFFLDLELNAGWVRILTEEGWEGFYRPDAGYFIDYPPVYLIVLTVVGWLDQVWAALTGTQALMALLKLPPILADVATAALLAPLAARVVGAWAAVPAAGIFLFNPAVIFDSALYGQNDSVGMAVVVAALACLIRGWTEASAALAVLATLVKFQFGFIIPVVLVAGLRRHLTRPVDPLRVLTSLAAATLTLVLVMAPFRLALYDAGNPARSLWHRFTAASEAFPGVTQNAFNLWMNPLLGVLRHEADGTTTGSIVADWTTVAVIGPVGVTWQLVGALLFGCAALVAVWLVVRRGDPVAVMLATFLLATALYVFPTRIHERYLVPALAVGVPLAFLAHRGWRITYVVLSAVSFFAIYFVYTLPNLNRHLQRDPLLNASLLAPPGIYAMSAAAVAACAWLIWQALRASRRSSVER